MARAEAPGQSVPSGHPALGSGSQGGAGRQLDAAAICGPFRRAGASSAAHCLAASQRGSPSVHRARALRGPVPRPARVRGSRGLRVGPRARPARPARRLPAPGRCALGRGAGSSRAVGPPGAHRGHSPRSAQPYGRSAATERPAHSGAECPATGNNRHPVRGHYGCERRAQCPGRGDRRLITRHMRAPPGVHSRPGLY